MVSFWLIRASLPRCEDERLPILFTFRVNEEVAIASGFTITTGGMAAIVNKIADFVYSGIRPDRPKAVASLDGSLEEVGNRSVVAGLFATPIFYSDDCQD